MMNRYGHNIDRTHDLFEFTIQGNKFRYTNSQEEVYFNNDRYQPIAISRDVLTLSSDINKGDTTISIDKKSSICQLLRFGVPLGGVSLKISVYSKDSIITPTFLFNVASVSVEQKGASLECTNLSSLFKNALNSNKYSRFCRLNVYSELCGIDRGNHSNDTRVIGRSSSSKVQFASLPNPYDYVGGYIEYSHVFPSLAMTFTYRNNIIGINEEEITLSSNDYLLQDGVVISVFKGCDKTIKTCSDRFGNDVNYGGQLHMPIDNPNSTQSF